MKLMKTVRMFGIIAALLGAAPIQSFALPTNKLEIVYFSDATYTNEGGDVFRGCQGDMYRQGKSSRYRATSSTPCRAAR
jgi:hypothetical protein